MCKSAVGNAPCLPEKYGTHFAEAPPDTAFGFIGGGWRRRTLKKAPAAAAANGKPFPGSRHSLLQYDYGYDGYDMDPAEEMQNYMNFAGSDEMTAMMYDQMGCEPKVVKIRSLQPVPSTKLMAMGIKKYDSIFISLSP